MKHDHFHTIRANSILLIIALFFILPFTAESALMEQLAIDARASSLAGSVTASPKGIMSIHYNPAGLSGFEDGEYIGIGFIAAKIDSKSKLTADPAFDGFFGSYKNDPLAGQTGEVTGLVAKLPILGEFHAPEEMGGILAMPASGGIVVKKPDSPLTLAYGSYVPFAGGYYYDDDDPMVFGGQSAYLQHLVYAAPTASYRFSDSISAGFGIGFGQTAMGLKMLMRAPNDLVALTRELGVSTTGLEIPILSAITLPAPWFGGGLSPFEALATMEMELTDNYSPSYNAGFLWEPADFFSFGFTYQSAIKTIVQGRYEIRHSADWQNMIDWFGKSPILQATAQILGIPYIAVPGQSGVAMYELEFPQMIHAGFKVKPHRRVAFLFDLHWADWSVMKTNHMKFDQDIQLLQFLKLAGYAGGSRDMILERNSKDTLNWSTGVEVALYDWLELRCGYEDRKTSVRDEYFDALAPLTDLDVYAAGFGITLKSGIVIDAGISFMDGQKFRVPNNSSLLMNSTNFTKPVYNPYAGLNYETEMNVYIASLSLTAPLGMLINLDFLPAQKPHENQEETYETFLTSEEVRLNEEAERVKEMDVANEQIDSAGITNEPATR